MPFWGEVLGLVFGGLWVLGGWCGFGVVDSIFFMARSLIGRYFTHVGTWYMDGGLVR